MTSDPPPPNVASTTSARTAAAWRLRTTTLACGPLPRLMGIVNVTPDSFSDGGRFFDSGRAIEQALRLADEGADLLDIGGESTRPFSEPVPEHEERRRVVEVVRAVCRQTRVPVSCDTSKGAVAAAALEAGAEIINDVTGFEGDPAMLALAVRSGAGLCAMHMQGTPQTMQLNPVYENVVADVRGYLRRRREALQEAGVLPERICLDPGIGFGKTHQHNLELLSACHTLHQLGCPLLVGPSRKGFIGKVLQNAEADRTWGTVGVALALARQGVQVLRVHDVRPVREALLLFAAAGGLAAR